MDLEVYVSAVKVGVPATKIDVVSTITTINTLLADDFPVQLAPYVYDEFIDHDYDDEVENTSGEEHDAFEHDVFAEHISDLWTTVNTLHRNGDNQKVRNLHAFLDQFILGVDCVDIMSSLDL
jgi:hypothetical protein